jgi:hypothetical protein
MNDNNQNFVEVVPTSNTSRSFDTKTAKALLVLSLVAGQAWPAQAAPELPPGHTAQDIIVPMYGNAPNTTFTVVRNTRWAVVNTPLATKNADGTTYTLLDGRPCPPERDERGCNTANKIVLQSIINEQEIIPLVQPINTYSRQSTVTVLAFEELRVPWSTAVAYANPKFTIKKEEVPKLKSFKDGLPLLAQLAKNLPEWEIAAKKLDELRGTTREMESVNAAKENYMKYATLTWEKSQNLVASK